MKRNRVMTKKRPLKNNNHRRLMMKRAHQRVLHRRRQFNINEMFTSLPENQ